MILTFRPCVYMRDRTHSYLWIRDEHSIGIFLTMDTGNITVAKVEILNPEAGGDPAYRVYEDRENFWDLTPMPGYNPMKAIQKYHESLLDRSSAAERIMRKLLDLPPLEGEEEAEDPITPGPRTKPTRKERKAAQAASGGKPAKSSGGGGYSLATLCEELKMDPAEARKILRNKKIEKPGGKWEWPNAAAAASVRTALEG